VDANRAVTDLDPAMIEGAWPGVLVPTEYTSRGMGVIRRYALPGVPLYASKLTPEQISGRLEGYYRPYREALAEAIESAYASFGRVWHVNCHSMKSMGNKMNVDAGEARPDFVISDRKGLTCERAFTDWTVDFFSRMGYTVKVNDPYSGGDIVKTYGQPARGRNSLQIEVNRRLYLDESSYEKAPGFTKLRADLSAYAEALASYTLLKLGASGL
jgi:N-formylglutamate deformylase